MKKIVLYISFIVLAFAPSFAQKLTIVRTDVDSLRKSFITSTYKFGFDVYIDNIKSCNGVAFQLNFNHEDVIKYSDYQSGDFGQPYVIYSTDGNGNGKLIVGVTTGTKNLPDSILKPKVIHLEFVVLQTAINGDTTTFNFANPIATVNKAGIGSTVSLGSEPIKFAIHSFVNVWPGDTDNNGIVDHLDFGPVSQYVGMGSATKNMKSFKRKSQSSIWGGHKCLVWDSAAVTYADCDGNGDITISDMLIVTYNIGKDTTFSKIQKSEGSSLQTDYPKPLHYNSDLIRIPLKFNSDRAFLAATGKILFNKEELNIIGIENSDVFNENEFAYNNLDDNSIEFIVGSYTRKLSSKNSGVLCYLVCEKINPNASFIVSELRAIDDSGIIYPLNSVTTVEEDNPKFSIINSNHQLIINNDQIIKSVSIIDYAGNVISTYSPNSNQFSIELNSFSNGIYFLEYTINHNKYLNKIFIYR